MAGLKSHWPDLDHMPSSEDKMDAVMIGLSQAEY